MTVPEVNIWKTKLAAWLHDPPEKALILSRTREGHEGGTVARLYEFCFGHERLGKALRDAAHLADTWAAAADRPEWPRPKEEKKKFGSAIRFWSRSGAQLVHPLGGDHYKLEDLYVDASGRIVRAAGEEMRRILAQAGESDDPEAALEVPGAQPITLSDEVLGEELIPAELGKEEVETAKLLRRAVLTLWRLGPVSAPSGLDLGEVWRLLPADARVPDHSIWEHLALASAFAGARAADPEGNPALLLVSVGSVQQFIEQARSTSDLWAGSHLMSCLAWEAMKVVVERFGPDAVIIPSLWGVPLVDVWLKEQGVVVPDKGDPRRPAWLDAPTDSNPLFSPCLPNRFVAVVPYEGARELAGAIEERVQEWAKKEVNEAAKHFCQLAGEVPTKDMEAQIEQQLAKFPEVQWVAVPFAPLVQWKEREGRHGRVETVASAADLEGVLQQFYPENTRPGFLASELWQLLERFIGEAKKEVEVHLKEGGAPFVFTPNPGVLYPALRDLADRTLGAVKATRRFPQTREEGYRCTVCGEREWLRGPGDGEPPEAEKGKRRPRAKFELPKGQRGTTLWDRLAEHDRRLVRKGEHLCALCACKRLWPERFTRWASQQTDLPQEEGEQAAIRRYVVSIYTMAIAADLVHLPLTQRPGEKEEDFERRREALKELCSAAAQSKGWAVLPKRLADELDNKEDNVRLLARRLPELLEPRDEEKDEDEPSARTRARVADLWQQAVGHRPETYYGLILMDGDGMGKWLSGHEDVMLRLEDLWHPDLVTLLRRRYPRSEDVARKLLDAPRPASPAYHAALSGAMNGLALEVARWVVEELFYGRLIYSGGDDVLAMVTVDDLLPCLFALRCAFSGVVPAGEADSVEELYRQLGTRLGDIGGGYVRLHDRLHRMLGGRMTASAGAVVAHHQAPLQAVLRRLREAEQEAKANDRNSFAVVVSKRGGGESTYVASWGFGGVADRQGGFAGGDFSSCRDVPYVPERWGEATKRLVTPIGSLLRLRNTLALPFVSRRAVYRTLEWLAELPCAPQPGNEADDREMLVAPLAWQLERQGVKRKNFEKQGYAHLLPKDGTPARDLAEKLVDVALRQCRPYRDGDRWRSVPEHLEKLLITAEFLAREGRAPQPVPTRPQGGAS